MQVMEVDSWDAHPGLLSAWNDLVAASAADSIFLTHEWLTSWWDAFRADRELKLIVCTEGDGEVVGVIPLYRTRVRTELRYPLELLRLVGDGTFDSDNLDVIARRGYEDRVVGALLDWLLEHRREWDLFELNGVRADSLTVGALTRELPERHLSHAEGEEPHAVIMLPETWDAYLATLSPTMRSGLRRKERDLHKRHRVDYRRCERESELPAFLDQLYRMHADRWQHRGQAGSFADPARRVFYETVAPKFLANGWLRFFILEVDGEPAAAEFGFTYGLTHSFLQSGFFSAFERHSVGVVLKTHILKSLIEDGVGRYDFLQGGEAYKMSWGPTLVRHTRARFAAPRSAGAAFIETREVIERAKAWLHRHLPESVSSPLRRGFRRLRPHRGGIREDRPGGA